MSSGRPTRSWTSAAFMPSLSVPRGTASSFPTTGAASDSTLLCSDSLTAAFDPKIGRLRSSTIPETVGPPRSIQYPIPTAKPRSRSFRIFIAQSVYSHVASAYSGPAVARAALGDGLSDLQLGGGAVGAGDELLHLLQAPLALLGPNAPGDLRGRKHGILQRGLFSVAAASPLLSEHRPPRVTKGFE